MLFAELLSFIPSSKFHSQIGDFMMLTNRILEEKLKEANESVEFVTSYWCISRGSLSTFDIGWKWRKVSWKVNQDLTKIHSNDSNLWMRFILSRNYATLNFKAFLQINSFIIPFYEFFPIWLESWAILKRPLLMKINFYIS